MDNLVLRKGTTLEDILGVITENTCYINALCELIEGYDASITSEPLIHAISLIKHLNNEVVINEAILFDNFIRRGNNHG